MKQNFKKALALLVATIMLATLAASLAACGDNETEMKLELRPVGDVFRGSCSHEYIDGTLEPSKVTKVKLPAKHKGLPVKYELMTVDFPNLKKMTMSGKSKFYNVKDNVLYSKDFSRICFIPCGIEKLKISAKTVSGAYIGPHSNLSSIKVENGNTRYHSAGNCLIETESKTLLIVCKNSVIPTDGSVTSIGSYAFSGCTGLTNVTIPDSVTSIGYSAFSGCTGLTNVTIPDSVTSIGDSAFNGCTGLTSITIPDSVTSIGDSAFNGCTGLTSITIPDSVTSIGDDAFSGCTGLASITVSENNSEFASVDGILYDKNKTKIILVPKAIQGAITIPDSVTSIGDSAFRGCTGLTGITIPNSVTSIDDYAFYECRGLTSVTIPDSVTSIGDSAFRGCTELTSVTIGSGVTSIDNRAFEDCYKLIEVYNKSSLIITVGSSDNGYVAYYAKNVYTTEGGSKLSTNEDGYVIYTDGAEKSLVAYAGTETELTLPSYITQINQNVFRGCTGLTNITIPDNVTSIGSYAFYDCSGLTSVIIPDSVTSIGYSAFSGCTGLTSITFNGTMEQWDAIRKGSYWNHNVPASCNVYCTDGTI